MPPRRWRESLAVPGTVLFFFLAPGIVAGVLPWWLSRRANSAGFAWPVRCAGVALLAAAVLILVDSFWRFAIKGKGTPAPVLPTQRLIVTGWYRYVRNPMYVAVLAAIFGQGFAYGGSAVLGYGALVAFAFHLFVRLYEEPVLHRTYGAEYESFCSNVPRWIPRLTPWQPLTR